MSVQPLSHSTAPRHWLGALAMTGVMALCAQISVRLPYTPVPATMQVFGVLLSGLLLGSRWGAVAQAQYLALGAMGLPVFAEHHSAPALFGLTGGYLWSYPLAAFVVGWLVERAQWADSVKMLHFAQLWACAAGLVIIYGLGCTWLAALSHPMLSVGKAIMAGAGWFFVWDTVKALGAILVANGWKGARGNR